MATAQLFTPAQPPRTPDWQSFWHLLYGERMRSTVYGVAEPAFDVLHARRRFLHFWTHIVNDPDMIGHVLLDNHANYARPKLTRPMLRPLLGNGLLNAEGDDWRRQRRLVAPTSRPRRSCGWCSRWPRRRGTASPLAGRAGASGHHEVRDAAHRRDHRPQPVLRRRSAELARSPGAYRERRRGRRPAPAAADVGAGSRGLDALGSPPAPLAPLPARGAAKGWCATGAQAAAPTISSAG